MSQAQRMRTVLLRLELLSQGSTQAWNASGGHSGEPDDRMVAIVARSEKPLLVFYREMFDRAWSDRRREEIIEAAEKEVNDWVKRPAPAPEQTKPLEEWILEDGVGYEPEIVARKFNVDAAFVRRVRQRNGRGSEDGRVTEVVLLGLVERAAKARELRDKGLSLRQIGMYLNVGASTVSRYLSEGQVN